MHILIHNALMGIHDQYHHMGIFYCLERLYDRELLHYHLYILASPHTSGIDQCIFLVFTLVIDVYTVTGGSRLIEYDNALFSQQTVHQCRLADIGASHNSDPDAVRIALPLKLLFNV